MEHFPEMVNLLWIDFVQQVVQPLGEPSRKKERFQEEVLWWKQLEVLQVLSPGSRYFPGSLVGPGSLIVCLSVFCLVGSVSLLEPRHFFGPRPNSS